MDTLKERIMLVESEAEISNLIAQQTLRPLGYQVEVIESASTAIKEIDRLSPDLIITDLDLPGISGKDLLVALTSQGRNLPIIVITPKGHESDALQAFRLGAMNFLTYPLREAEVANVVEDTLQQFRHRIKFEQDAQQLALTKVQLERHIDDLVEIFSIGKLIPSASNQQMLYEKVISVASRVAQAEISWMTVLDIQKNKYVLRACLDVDESLLARLNQPHEDSLNSLVAVSGQIVAAHGEALGRYDLPGSIEAILAVPIKWKDEVIGTIITARKTPEPFTAEQQAMLEVIADYASAIIENTRRFQILEQRLFHLQQSSIYTSIDANLKYDLLHQASLELRKPIRSLQENLDLLTNQADSRLSHKQSVALNIIEEETDILADIADAMLRLQSRETSRLAVEVDLNELVREVVNHYLAIAQVCRISLKMELPSTPARVMVFPAQITKVIEGLLSNALKYSPTKSQVTIRVEQKADRAIFALQDQGNGVEVNLLENIFDKKAVSRGEEPRRFGGIGISLPMIKEIISAHKGEIWIESGYGKGFNIYFSLPH